MNSFQDIGAVKQKGILAFVFMLCAVQVHAQVIEDSIHNLLAKEVVVTATRSERRINDLPIPISAIYAEEISISGNARLHSVIEQMTGLTLIQDHGNGVQIQGFDPDYTLIMIDQAPVIGRTAGTLDLSRIATSDISRIEIVKGPSSSLYGSEALAGVINIITKTPSESIVKVETQYGTHATLDVSATASMAEGDLKALLSADYYRTSGYDLNPDDGMKTIDPYSSYSIFGKTSYRLASMTLFEISSRYYNEMQQPVYLVSTANKVDRVVGDGIVTDFSITPHLSHFFTDNLKTDIHLYSSIFGTKSSLQYESDGSLYDESFFDQTLLRPELMCEYVFAKNNTLTSGAGYSIESVKATRYEGTKTMGNAYAFAQYDWIPHEDINIIVGLRYDDHTAYASQLSPKLSLRYSLSEAFALRGSVGSGFKSPDFRQLYLTFTNPVAGYSVYGSQEVAVEVQKLDQEGQISEILIPLENFNGIRAESSIAYNLGMQFSNRESGYSVDANLFYNNVINLIDSEPVAQKTNGQVIFSYVNKNRVATYGLEMNNSWKLTPELTISAGYQYLQAIDLDLIKDIADGKIYRRDPLTLETERVSESDYGGLFNRSVHMANAKIYFQDEKSGIDASIRNVYRGRYGFADKNGNQILDADNEYAPGYYQMNISIRKSFEDKYFIQLGCDNLFDYTNPEYTPMIAGRLLWGKIGVSIN